MISHRVLFLALLSSFPPMVIWSMEGFRQHISANARYAER